MNAAENTQTVGVDQTVAQMIAELAELKALNAALLSKQPKPSDRTTIGEGLSCKVSEKGAISVYGIHSRFPITLYKSQWFRLFSTMATLRAFIEANDSKLTTKQPKPAVVK